MNYYSLNDVTKLLQIPPYRVIYLLSTGQIPEPARIGGRRVFTMQDIQRISEKLELQLAQQIEDGGTDEQ